MRILILCLFVLPSLARAELKHESEISTVTTGGNSNVETYLIKTANQYTEGLQTYRFGGHYTYGEANEDVNVRDWDANLKAERLIEERLAVLVGGVAEGYQFQGIRGRYNADTGLKYYYIKSDPKNFFSELGYRYTVENRYNEGTVYENKARLYTEFNSKYSETMQYRLWLEYVPNFSDTRDYLLTYEASLTAILTSIFSLRVAYKGIYDQVPAIEGNKNYDFNYTTSLVAKF